MKTFNASFVVRALAFSCFVTFFQFEVPSILVLAQQQQGEVKLQYESSADETNYKATTTKKEEGKWRRRSMTAKPIDYNHFGGHPFDKTNKNKRTLMQLQDEGSPSTDKSFHTRLRKLEWGFGGDDEDTGDVGPDPNYDPLHVPSEYKFDPTYFRPIRIKFKYDHLPSTESATMKHVQLLQEIVMPQVAEFWGNTLSVFPTKMLYVDSNECTLSSVTDFVNGVADTDVLIQVVNNEKFCGGNTIAAANSCDWDEYDRPIGGLISFCFSNIQLRGTGGGENELASEAEIRKVVSAGIHEVAHILGFHENDLAYFYDIETGEPRTPRPIPQNKSHKCIAGDTQKFDMPGETTVRLGENSSGSKHYELVTPRVVQTARNHFNCQSMEGVRLENQPTGGACIGTHFDERLFFTESMSAIATTKSIPAYLSPMTLALFEDSGWYLANYTNVGVSPFGHGRGCEFVNEPCIVKGKVPTYSEGAFCDVMGQEKFSCDPTHSIMAHCDLMDYSAWGDEIAAQAPPSSLQYFPGKPFYGGKVSQADYCPTWSVYVSDCKGPPLKPDKMKRAESFGHENSRCINSNDLRPLCMEAICNEEQFTIDIIVKDDILQTEEVFTCGYEEAGKRITLERDGVGIFCPNFADFCPDMLCPSSCSGRGICNYDAPDRPRCECFDTNEQSPNCQTLEIDYNQVFEPPPAPPNRFKPEQSSPSLTADKNEDREQQTFENDNELGQDVPMMKVPSFSCATAVISKKQRMYHYNQLFIATVLVIGMSSLLF